MLLTNFMSFDNFLDLLVDTSFKSTSIRKCTPPLRSSPKFIFFAFFTYWHSHPRKLTILVEVLCVVPIQAVFQKHNEQFFHPLFETLFFCQIFTCNLMPFCSACLGCTGRTVAERIGTLSLPILMVDGWWLMVKDH